MILPQSYLDKTCGVRPEANGQSFNNIVYTAWYHIARLRQGQLDNDDLKCLIKHIDLNEDEHNLYAPKNSHDNITYKIICSKVFNLNKTEGMSFFQAVKDIGFFRIWDVITYGAVFGPKLLRPLFSLFLWIPALQMIHACKSGDKIRPDWFERDGSSRIKWWFKRDHCTKLEERPTMTIKTWKLKNGETRQSKHMQNDGKHISIFRLFALQHQFKTFKLTAKICRKIMIDKYGEDYTFEVINRYFRDRNHPLIPMWRGHGDILK